MNPKKIVVFIVVLGAIGAGVYYLLKERERSVELSPLGGEEGIPSPAPLSSVGVGTVSVVVQDQAPGKTIVVREAELPQPGFLVVHADAGEGRPAGVVAVSALIAKGKVTDVSLSTDSVEFKAGKYLIMPHLDDGDGAFVFSKDVPFTNDKGELFLFPFEVGVSGL